MYTKMLIKFFVVVFGINLAIVGIVWQQELLLWLSLINILALFVILFQQNAFLRSQQQNGERVLFAPDVFALISVWAGALGAYLLTDFVAAYLSSFILLAILIGGSFYLISIWLFRMVTPQFWSHRSVNLLAGMLVLVIVMGEGSWIYQSYGNQLSTLWQDVMQREFAWDSAGENDLLLPAVNEGSNEGSSEETILHDDKDGSADPIDTGRVVLEGTDLRGDEELSPAMVEGQELTYGNLLPLLVERYALTADTSRTADFVYVAEGSPLYEPFLIGKQYRMIGTNTSPESLVTCKHLMVLLGLAEGRAVSYSAGGIFDAYRQEAERRGYLQAGCDEMDQIATRDDLP